MSVNCFAPKKRYEIILSNLITVTYKVFALKIARKFFCKKKVREAKKKKKINLLLLVLGFPLGRH